MKLLTRNDVEKMSYVQLLANIDEINRPPGGKDSIRRIVQNTFLTRNSMVLDVGCNTGYSSFEIAHLVKCSVFGVDISPEMINTAERLQREDADSSTIQFRVADGMDLPFDDESFDLVMSGGSTAFIDDKMMALQEYTRVTKMWGFVADVNFYYKSPPPSETIEKLNCLMGIAIQPWGKEYWLEIYHKTGLEIYYTHYADVYVPSADEIAKYCEGMSATVRADSDAQTLIHDRLVEIMTLFTNNHRYLSYGVFVLRKRRTPEQSSLFGA